MSSRSDTVIQKFVTEGNFVTMPLSFPSVSAPIQPEDSHITALSPTELSLNKKGLSYMMSGGSFAVFGLTSGEASHLFMASPKARGGYVVDMGVIDGADRGVWVGVHQFSVLACANGPAGGKVVKTRLMWVTDGVQEWGFGRQGFETLAELPGEDILDAVFDADSEQLTLLTDRRIVRVQLQTVEEEFEYKRKKYPHRKVEFQSMTAVPGGDTDAPAVPALAQCEDGSLYVTCQGARICRLRSDVESCEPTGCELPFQSGGWGWEETGGGRFLCAGPEGGLFRLDTRTDTVERLGEVLVTPVKWIAAMTPCRAYAFYGEEVGRLGRIDLESGEVTDLGAILSVLGVKRYGNTFACAATGPDGEVYMGEDDRGGHLWIYFPPVTG